MENMPETSTYVPNITKEMTMMSKGGSGGQQGKGGRGLQRGGSGGGGGERRGPPPDGGQGGGRGPPPDGEGGKGGGPSGSRSDDPSATASGVYITGAWLFNALDGNNLDAVEQEARSLDLCLSHASPFGGFHYHSWTPCLKENWTASKTDAPGLCMDDEMCMNDWEGLVLDKAFKSKA